MRNFFAFIGVAIGGYLGWFCGTAADAFAAVVTQAQPGHKYSVVVAVVMACVWGHTVWRVIGEWTARRLAAEADIDRLAAKTERTGAHSGRTPPASFPAFQA